jgi:hypothetical protein
VTTAQMPSPRIMVDLNSLLKTANAVICVLIASGLFTGRQNEYADGHTLALGVLLCVQTHIVLTIERGRRDPFILLMTFSMIFYWSLRVYTMSVMPFSWVFERFGFTPADANYALVFIVVGNLLIYGGLLAVRTPPDRMIDTVDWRAVSPRAVIALMLIVFSMAYFAGGIWTPERMPRALRIVKVLLVPDIVVPMVLAYYLLFRRTLTRPIALSLGTLLVLEALAHTLWGSRSAIVVLVQTLLLVLLAVNGAVKVRRRWVAFGVISLPVMIASMVAVFAISTYNRLTRIATSESQSLDVGLALKSATEGGTSMLSQGVDVLLPPVLARAGYFDFSAELIAHRDEYRQIINLPAYGRSLVDNLLTPGFDLWDQPRMSNAMRFVYLGGTPSKRYVDEFYHSDQLGIHGELYTLFGWGALPLFFLIPYFIKRSYARASGRTPFDRAMKRVILLLIFIKLVDSYGLDWIIIEMLPFVIAVAIYSAAFSSRRVVSEQDAPGASRGLAPA